MMGKIRKEYKEERMESYGYTSHSSGSSQTSGSSESSSSGSESSSSVERKKKHIKKKSKYKREKKRKSESANEADYIERERRKKRKHTKHRDVEEISEDEEYIRIEERKHRSRKHKHHHRKHKHKHRRHRHHRSEEEYQERGRGASVDRSDSKREREEWDDRKNDKIERESRGDREMDRKNRKEEKRHKERGDGRQPKSKWDDEDDAQYNINNKRIKPDPDNDDSRGSSRIKQDGDRPRKRREREETAENGRPNWGTSENLPNNVKQENTPTTDEVQKPNMALSGKLSEDTNMFNGVVIKYSQPPEARKPKRRWRWYIFKGEEDLPFLPLHRQSAYLIGRDRKVADIPTDHPSCSKQHAVLQYRLVSYDREDGTKGRTVKPYILDLESANGTYVNNRRVEPRRFVELLEKDVVKFGYSSREYILLHEGSKGDDADAPDMGVDMSPISLLRS